MRILSGLAGKMAPASGPPAKDVPTSSAAVTTVPRRVAPVSQRRRGDSRGEEVQHQAVTAVAPCSGSVESQADGGRESCPSACPPVPGCGGGGAPGTRRMEGGASERQSAFSRSSSRDARNAESSRRGPVEQQAAHSRGSSRDLTLSHLSRKNGGLPERQRPAASSNSRSRVRQYRKRVCVRWGSLQWSLALVLVVRSAAAGCQRPHHHHNAAATPHTLAVA